MAELISPTRAAETLGVSDAMLRQLASERYYGDWLEAPRDERNFRSYTERDMALLRYVIRTERRGIPHKVIKESLQARGVDACLEEALGAEELNPMLQAMNQRLLNENATLVREREAWLQQRQAQNDEINLLKDQVREAETLANKIRLAGYVFSRDASERIEVLKRNIASLDRELTDAEGQYDKAMQQLQEIRAEFGRFWARLLRGGQLSAQLAEAVVRLETADQRRQRIREGFAEVLTLTDQFLLGELQKALQLQPEAGSTDDAHSA